MTLNDDDRSARSQVTLRLERELLEAIDALARDEGIDRTELTRRLLTNGLAQRRIETALADYAAGRRSAWSAADRAGIDLYQMLDRIEDAGVPYRLDTEALDRLGRSGPPSAPVTATPREVSLPTRADADPIALLRAEYRPRAVRLLFIGESAPASGSHFYLANSNLFRATREAFARGLGIADPPDGAEFLAWFRDLGCWLVDLADRPVNRSEERERTVTVDAGVPEVAGILRDVNPSRVVVVLRRIAPAVRRAATAAGFDDRAIDVLPFPIRQWRPEYVIQLAAIVAETIADTGPGSASPRATRRMSPSAVAEQSATYGTMRLHEVMADLLRQHGDTWSRASAIARAIADGDLWRRPSDNGHPAASQISARARKYPDLFQVSDLGIRLRRA